MSRSVPTPEQLRSLLHYNPSTGALTWLERPNDGGNGWKRFNARNAGRPALTNISSHGYLRGSVLYVGMLAHRVAWAIHYGEHPDEFIDHINGIKTDNRISNLRGASLQQNAWNNGGRKRTSKYKGVSLLKSGRWHARVCVDGVAHLAGDHDDEVSAALAHDYLASKLHGDFARLNFPAHTILSRGRA